MLGFFFNAHDSVASIELDNPIAFRVGDAIAKYDGAALVPGSTVQQFGETVAVKDVISEYQCDIVSTDVIRTDDQSLGEAFGTRLLGIANRQAEQPRPDQLDGTAARKRT